MKNTLIGMAVLAGGALVAVNLFGVSDYMTERIALEDSERHAAFDSLATNTTGGDKAVFVALSSGSIPSTLTATDTERIASKVTNKLWKRRLLDYAAWIRWQQSQQ